MIYVGTVHGDLKGFERLSKLIDVYKPKVMSFEYPSDWSVEEVFREVVRRGEERITLLEAIPRTNRTKLFKMIALALEFEGRIAGICKRKGLNVRFIDMPGTKYKNPERRRRTDYDSMDEDELIKRYSCLKDSAYFNGIDEEYLEEMAKILGYGQAGESISYPSEKRERCMARKVRKIEQDMHVGGISHIFRLPTSPAMLTLWERVSLPDDKRLRLIEADEIKLKCVG